MAFSCMKGAGTLPPGAHILLPIPGSHGETLPKSFPAGCWRCSAPPVPARSRQLFQARRQYGREIKIAKAPQGSFLPQFLWQRGCTHVSCHPGTCEPSAGSGSGASGLFWGWVRCARDVKLVGRWGRDSSCSLLGSLLNGIGNRMSRRMLSSRIHPAGFGGLLHGWAGLLHPFC